MSKEKKGKQVKITVGSRDIHTTPHGTLKAGETYMVGVSIANYFCNKRKDATLAGDAAKTVVEKAAAAKVELDKKTRELAEQKQLEAEAKAKLEAEAA